MKAYFFGCESRNRMGHFFYKPGFRVDYGKGDEINNVLGDTWLDGGLLNEAGVRDIPGNGVYAQRGGYSFVAWWDRGGDSRGASNSTFIVEGDYSPQEVMRLGREAFPSLVGRSKVTLPDGTKL